MKHCIHCGLEKGDIEFNRFRTECKDCNKIKCKRYYQNHREYMKKQAMEWAYSETGKISRAISQKKRIGTEKFRAAARKYSRTPRGQELRRERWNRWVKTDKGRETHLRKVHKRRNTFLQIVSTLTSEEWKDILFRFSNRCFYCNEEFNDILKPTRDHVIPIIKGGHHIKENIVPACRPCNSRKGAT